MKMTQLFRKHNGVLELRYVTMLLIWLVIFRENFMEDKLTALCCDLLWNFMALALSVGVIFREKWRNWRLLFLLLSFLFTNLLTNMMFTSKEKHVIRSVCQSNRWSTKCEVGCQLCWRSVQDAEDELDWTEDWCGMTADCQIRTEIQACDWANMQSRKQRRV